MKKLDKDQMPKVVGLGVLTALVIGYAGYSWLGGGGAPAPAVASTPHPTEQAAAPAKADPANPVLQLAAIDHADPFRPVLSLESGSPAPNKPAPPPKPGAPAAKPPAPPAAKTAAAPLQDNFNGPAMEALPGVEGAPAISRVADTGANPAPAPAPAAGAPAAGKPSPKPAAAAPPSPPAMVVTGILEGNENVAILKWSDDHRQVVRVGDRLDGGFLVKAIRTDAVVLAHGSFQWTSRLGAEKPTAN